MKYEYYHFSCGVVTSYVDGNFLLHTASLLKAVKFTEYASPNDTLCLARLAGTQ